MFQIHYGGQIRPATTRAQVVAVLAEHGKANRSTISVTRDGQPVPLFHTLHGDVSIQFPGNPHQVLQDLLQEVIEDLPAGETLPKPWEMTRMQWESICALRELSTFRTIPGLDIESLPVNMVEGSSARFLLDKHFQERFGYSIRGPIPDGESQNERYEVQVGYAIARGERVPDFVFAQPDLGLERGLEWVNMLLRCPELRGKLPYERYFQLYCLFEAGRNCQPLQPQDVPELLQLLKSLPATATIVEVDDLLYAAGKLKMRELPSKEQADLSGASSLVRSIRSRVIEAVHQRARRSDADAREKGQLTQREQEFRAACRELDRSSWPVDGAVRLEAHLLNRNVAGLLAVLDTPDGQNIGSKRALEDFAGIKLIGLNSRDRRAAVFRLAGMSPEQQAEWEAAEKHRQTQAAAAREAQAVVDVAERHYLRWQGREGTARDYVDDLINRLGGSMIRAERSGATNRYRMVAGNSSWPLSHANGSLAYARQVLATKDLQAA